MPLGLDELSQAFDDIIPLARDLIEIVTDLAQTTRLESPHARTAHAHGARETSGLERAQVLRDRLPRHVRLLGQLRNRARTTVAELEQEPEARGIAERGEDGCRLDRPQRLRITRQQAARVNASSARGISG